MLPLTGAAFPNSHQELSSAIRSGLAAYGVTARDVAAEGGAFPSIDSLRIDLTGARFTREQRPPAPGASRPESISVANLQVGGNPVELEGMPAKVELRATGVVLQGASSGAGETQLTLQRADNGDILIEAERSALEKLLHALANEAARKHGVEIKETRIELVSKTPRAVAFRADVTAKAFLFTAPVTISGNVTVDDALNLQLSDLAISGSGMAANLAGSFLRPQFDRIQQKPIPLSVLSLGDVKLRDVRLTGGDTIRLAAEFGS